MDNEEYKSADDEEIKSVDEVQPDTDEDKFDGFAEDELESFDDEESEGIVVEKEVKKVKAKNKKKKPTNKRQRIITIVAASIVVVLIASIAVIAYFSYANSYVATVGNVKIPVDEYKYWLKVNKDNEEQQNSVQATTSDRKTYWTTKNAQTGTTPEASLKSNTLEFLNEIYLLSGEAIKKDAKAFDNQKTKTIDNIKNQYTQQKQSQSTFVKNLSDNYGLTYDRYVEFQTRYDLAAQYYQNSVKAINISDDQVLNKYNSNKATYDIATVKYSLYLTVDTTTQQPLSNEKITVAKNKAQAAVDKLNAGADVDKLITDESEDTNKSSNKGEAQFSLDPSNQRYLQQVADALKTMKVNESKVVEIPNYGYLALKYIKMSTFDDLKDQIKSDMQTSQFNTTLDSLKKASPLVENKKGQVIDSIDILSFK